MPNKTLELFIFLIGTAYHAPLSLNVRGARISHAYTTP
jgi:hypothetical protein